MIYTTKQLYKKYGSEAKVIKLVTEGKLFKISFGLYSDIKHEIADLETIFLRYPNSTLTNESAFAFYGLTDYIPENYYLATSINAHKIESNHVKQVYMSKSILKIGRRKVKTDVGHIYVYDKERMLIELFRLKTKFAPEFIQEVVRSYRELVANNELDIYKLTTYANKITYGDSILKRIMECVL